MRGFLQVKAKAEGMGAGTYANFVNAGQRTDTRTEDAKRRFNTPPYYFGDRRKTEDAKDIDRKERDIQEHDPILRGTQDAGGDDRQSS